MAERESSESLIQYLEQASGRKLRTREDIHRFLDELSTKSPQAGPASRFWTSLKQGMWLALLVVAYLQYYLLDVMKQVDDIPEIRVNLHMIKLHDKTPPRT